MTYNGVVVSLNPLKMPCIANVKRTAGAPNDLVTKYLCAGANIGESFFINLHRKIKLLSLLLLKIKKN